VKGNKQLISTPL